MRCKPAKQTGFLGGLFGGDSGSDFVAIKTGFFKGYVTCSNPEHTGAVKSKIKREAIKLLTQVKTVYKAENTGQESQYDPGRLQTIEELDEDRLEEELEQIRLLVTNAGLEKLNILQLI